MLIYSVLTLLPVRFIGTVCAVHLWFCPDELYSTQAVWMQVLQTASAAWCRRGYGGQANTLLTNPGFLLECFISFVFKVPVFLCVIFFCFC